MHGLVCLSHHHAFLGRRGSISANANVQASSPGLKAAQLLWWEVNLSLYWEHITIRLEVT